MSLGATSSQNLQANFLLGFKYQDDDPYYYEQQTYSNTYGNRKGAKRRGGKGNYHRPAKDYSVQSAFKFIVKNNSDYVLNLYDPNENVDWKDVSKVIFNMTNA